jgi:hypothetical protein
VRFVSWPLCYRSPGQMELTSWKPRSQAATGMGTALTRPLPLNISNELHDTPRKDVRLTVIIPQPSQLCGATDSCVNAALCHVYPFSLFNRKWS